MRLAIDIGGTFTDIVLEYKTNLFTKKVLTSTSKPEVAVIEGIVGWTFALSLWYVVTVIAFSM